MSLSIGIVGLPNVGKSTLFNAITNAHVDAENYPFCTIEPHSGIVSIPDKRLDTLAEVNKSEKTLYATIEFHDIAGLVKGASKGEGLGNQFLSNIRNTEAIAQVIRCFDDDNIVHVHNEVNPIEDAETINLELILADLELAEKLVANQSKKAKSNQKEEVKKLDFYQKILSHLETNKALRYLTITDEEKKIFKGLGFLTNKPIIYVANTDEASIGSGNPYTTALKEYATQQGEGFIILCATLEKELSELPEEERTEYLASYGVEESGLSLLSQACFKLLDLQTYLTTGPKESRAWTISKHCTAPQAAGVIHTDFEKGFIRANVIDVDTFIACNGWKTAKEKGKIRQEGKEYIMKENDVVEFLFNV